MVSSSCSAYWMLEAGVRLSCSSSIPLRFVRECTANSARANGLILVDCAGTHSALPVAGVQL